MIHPIHLSAIQETQTPFDIKVIIQKKTIFKHSLSSFFIEIHAFSIKNSLVQKYSFGQNLPTSLTAAQENKKMEETQEKQNLKLKKMQDKLFNLWDKFNISYHHREIFVENFRTIKNDELTKIVEQEIFKLEKNCSLIQVKKRNYLKKKIF